ncbi:NADH dehydrogenase [Asaia bogorensis NBRC 16594]|uniref:Malonic semialdehyde reductase RutE n=1 Tax=Asaia bogorensis NBRC 16594 TaxID=1231624 RepID=A0AAN4R1X9_9PROT|nr:NADH dehydrogenase/NAD(P)H nitroreductase [Asaia bogorensis NBRC 16594]GBQ74884.1 NADH dehydrogenase [Asaia bogorensis NBRC 16594]GEL52820.1 putative malonic semialdehyde reductase RutE [Asaia bogorensis NBRC 16594]
MSESQPESPVPVSLDGSSPDQTVRAGSTRRDHDAAPGDARALPPALDALALDRLFRQARTPIGWSALPVERETLVTLYDLVKLGPTSGNCCPARLVFLTSDDMKERLRPALSTGNIERCLSAPVVVLVCHDPLFFEHLPRLSREENLRNWFAADVGLSEETAFRNGSLQGGYMILAARALGLDVAPFSGFDSYTIEDDFLSDTGWRINFIAGLGYAEAPPPAERAMRLAFDEACLVL